MGVKINEQDKGREECGRIPKHRHAVKRDKHDAKRVMLEREDL